MMSLSLYLACIVAAQALLWRWVYDENSFCVRTIASWIRRRPARFSAVVANAGPQFATYGIPATEREPLLLCWIATNIFVPLHHALGAGFAMAAVRYGSEGCLRLALSFEVGEDVLHYLQMAWTYMYPERGIAPWKYVDGKSWAFIGVHHLIGLLAGSAAFLTEVAAWVEVQQFVALLLAAGLGSALKTPLELVQDLGPPSALGRVGLLLEILAFLLLCAIRLFVYFPTVASLLQRASADLSPTATYLYGGVLLGIAPVFNLASVVLYAPGVLERVRLQRAPIKDD